MAFTLGEAVFWFKGNRTDIDRTMGGVESDTESFSRRVSETISGGLTGGLNAVSETLKGVGTRLTVGLTAPIIGAGAAMLTTAGQFEAGMNRFASVTGTSLADAGFDLDDVRAKALKLGADTSFSAAQAQDAMIALAKGGVPVVDIMGKATDATLELASAGELELGPAADIMSKQLGVWAETGVTAAEVSNKLAQAANASTVDVDELALGLANVGGTAKVAGVDFGELTQTMALIAPNFSSAADAGTSLKTMISNLQPTTDRARQAMSDLGLLTFNTGKAMEKLKAEGITPASTSMQDLTNELRGLAGAQGMTLSEANKWIGSEFMSSKFYDPVTGAFNGMQNAAEQLNGATADLSEAEKVMAFNTIFGSDAIRAAAAVSAAGAPGFNAMGAAMDGAGTAAEQAAQKNKGWAFAVDTMMGSVETLAIQIGTLLLPMGTKLVEEFITPAVNGIGEWIVRMQDSNPAMLAIVAGVAIFAAALGPLLLALGFLAGAIANIITVATLVGPLFAGIGTVLAGPVILAIGAVVAILGTMYLAFSNNFMGIRDMAERTIMPMLQQLWDAFLKGLALLQPAWESMRATFQNWLPILQTVGAIIMGVVIVAFNAIVGFLTGAMGPAFGTISGIIQIFMGVLNTMAALIKGIVGIVVSLVQGDWKGAWAAAGQMVTDLVAAVNMLFSGMAQTVIGIIATFISGIVGFFQNLYNTLVGHSIIPDLVNGAIGLFNTLKSMALNAVMLLVNGAITFFSNLYTEGLAKATSLKDEVVARVTSLKELALAQFTYLKDLAIGLFGSLYGGAIEKAQAIVTDFPAKIGEILSAISAWYNRLYESGRSLITNFWNGMKAVWNDIINWINDGLEEIGDLLPGSEPKNRRSPLYGLRKRGQALVQNIQAGIDASKLDMSGVLNSARSQANSVTHNWNLNAQYGYQPADSLAQDIRVFQLLTE